MVLAGYQLLLLLVFPAVSPVDTGEMTAKGGGDPSYALYQKYRYAYENYVYLFLSEETGEGGEAGQESTGTGGQTAQGESGEGGSGVPETAGAGETMAEVYAKVQDYDYLMKRFYNVHPSTTAPREIMKAETFLKQDLALTKNSQVPQILVYHTHSQETYADYGPDRPEAMWWRWETY